MLPFELTKTPHTSPFRASYGVSFMSTSTVIDRVIKGFYCTIFCIMSLEIIVLKSQPHLSADNEWNHRHRGRHTIALFNANEAVLKVMSTWWRHQMETFTVLLPLCQGRRPVDFPHKGQWRGAVFWDLRLNKRLSKQLRHRWFDTPSRALWRHCNGTHNEFMI